ncbi:MAG: coproporphyrinogen dehydrogenase HemZ, partial [Oscillospiraceae bacterium]
AHSGRPLSDGDEKDKKANIVVARANNTRLMCCVCENNKTAFNMERYNEKTEKGRVAALSRLVYDTLKNFTGANPPWGLLTGVRPVRLIHDMWAKGMTDDEVKTKFKTDFCTSDEKYNLAMETAQVQKEFLKNVAKNDYSLYVAIPFCPSRCSYCSFVSRTTESSKALIQPYVEKLCLEIIDIKNIAEKCKLHLKTIYIGGGTPTSLNEEQLEMLMKTIKDCFDLSKVEEYTVEAGRPDCTNKAKLEIIKKYGATRLSINPQTFNDEVLKGIARRHTAQDIVDCYHMARQCGHSNINMDLIAGLPNESVESFENSLQTAISLKPENITVHTLTLKRASNLVIDSAKDAYADVSEMLLKQNLLAKSGYLPYYLYRQKNTLQNLENTGFCLKGFEGRYNIYIMEEVHTIISAGAGGVTKLCDKKTGRIDRVF